MSIGIYVLWRIAATGSFPELDPNTLLLLGVSQGVYIGSKLVGATALSRAQALKVSIDVHKEALVNVSSAIKMDEARLNDPNTPATDKPEIQKRIDDNKKRETELKAAIVKDEADLAKALKEIGLAT